MSTPLRTTWIRLSRECLCLAVAWTGIALGGAAEPPLRLQLLNQAAVDSQGVFLDQVVQNGAENPALHIRLADPPAAGQAVVLTRAHLVSTLLAKDTGIGGGVWSGADRVRVVRRTRVLKEAEVKEMLTSVLQREYVRDRGELELTFPRSWAPVAVLDEALEVKILDVPVAGVSPNFVVRFELVAGRETAGKWQVFAQAKVWKEIWVTTGPLKRGQMLGAADMAQERRDILSQRELLPGLPADESPLELVENLGAGAPICVRSVRAKPIVHRGDLIEALIRDGGMSISLKVEALEEGAFGQAIRVRNPETRRELRGKVQNEQSILVLL